MLLLYAKDIPYFNLITKSYFIIKSFSYFTKVGMAAKSITDAVRLQPPSLSVSHSMSINLSILDRTHSPTPTASHPQPAVLFDRIRCQHWNIASPATGLLLQASSSKHLPFSLLARCLTTSQCLSMAYGRMVPKVYDPLLAERRIIERMHLTGPLKKKRNKKKPLDGRPMMKGVVLKTLIKKPRKPNSANRKCVLVRLSNGKEAVAYVPGEGHNLQEHNVVLVRCGRLQDVPGVKLKVIRGKYDCAHVKKKTAV